MTTRHEGALRKLSWLGGAWLALGAAAPAFAARLDLPPLSEQDYLLGGLLLLLVVALIARLAGRREDEVPAPEGPDMRWWKNHPQM
jgi:preprotein translocase subunit SecY